MATVAIGNAANAGLLAVRMLAASDPKLRVSCPALQSECLLAAPFFYCAKSWVASHSRIAQRSAIRCALWIRKVCGLDP